MAGGLGVPEPYGFDAGISNCPICGRQWRVTPWDDCLMPACGHFGEDASPANPHRPCEACGIAHAMTCPTGTSVTDERTDHDVQP